MTPERWQQIEKLYYQALEWTPFERLAYLDQACGEDSDLRRELESLLAQDGSRLDRPAWEGAADLLTDSTVTQMPVGTRVGPYRIEAILGAGGMGVVYKALDTKLNRTIAIKFLSGDLADPAARRRFQREAQIASSLNHPHILTVYDAGEFEGRQYLVTEFVDGGTLEDRARASQRTWRQIVELLMGVADGLAAAHQAGVMHRDIKPQNILVAKNGYAKLADFGYAKLAESMAGEVTRTLTERDTRPGVIIGTIAYMSPEQASGQQLDARSDIFSFGVVLYEMLADKRPFTGTTDLELLKTIIHAEPEPLSIGTPAPLKSLVEKALEKDPADRYQSMREIVVDLRRAARQKPEEVAAPTVSVPSHPRSGIGPEVESLAVLPFLTSASSPEAEYLADGITESLINNLAQLRHLRVLARSAVFRHKGKGVDPMQVGRDLGVNAVLTGRIFQRGEVLVIGVELVSVHDGLQLWGQQYRRQLTDIFAIEDEISTEISGRLRVRLTTEEHSRLTRRYTEIPRLISYT